MKKKQNKVDKKVAQDKPVTLGDLLNASLVHDLKEKKKELQELDEQKQLAEEERKRQERKRKEKNKSFEDLLNESDFNWKDFK